jgi:hypothetical protein
MVVFKQFFKITQPNESGGFTQSLPFCEGDVHGLSIGVQHKQPIQYEGWRQEGNNDSVLVAVHERNPVFNNM